MASAEEMREGPGAPSEWHGDPTRTSALASPPPRARTLKRASSPRWQADLRGQVMARNAMETAPIRAIFTSYAALHRRVLALQQADNSRLALAAKNEELAARVRELEQTAANYSVRTAREHELERKKDELQAMLQKKTEMENEYYRGLLEAGMWKDKCAHLDVRATNAEADLACTVNELALVKKEYQALQSENIDLRSRIANADLYMMACKEANAKVARLEKRVQELEAEIARQRIVVARSGAGPDSGSLTRDASQRIADEEEENLPAGSGGPSGAANATSRSPYSVPDAYAADVTMEAQRAAMLLNPYPRRATYSIADAHRDAVLQSLCIGEGSRLCFTSGSDKVIKIWDTRSGQEKNSFSSGSSIALSLHAASHYLLAGCVDMTARFWDVRTLRSLSLVGHGDKIVSVALSGSAQHAFTASSDSTIKLWDVRRLAAVKTLMCHSRANDLAVSGNSIFSAHYNGNLVAWDWRAGARNVEVPRVHQHSATCVRISSDGRLCVSLGKDNTICVRDTRLLTRPLRKLTPSQLEVSMNWSRLALSPDSKVVAVGSKRGQIICCALEKSCEAEIAKVCPDFVNNFTTTASPVSRAALGGDTGSYDEGVMNTLERGHDRDSAVPCVAWGAETGAPLASIGDDRKLVLWY